MQKLVLFLVLQAMGLSATLAHAQQADEAPPGSGIYVGGSGALAYFSGIEGADYEFGFSVSGLAGLDISPGWRTELELTYAAAEFENSADETSYFKLGGAIYADFGNDWRNSFTPYAGLGLGIVSIDVGNDEDNTDISGHVEGGISLPLSDHLYLVPSVRTEYIILDDIDDQIVTHFRAGLRLGL